MTPERPCPAPIVQKCPDCKVVDMKLEEVRAEDLRGFLGLNPERAEKHRCPECRTVLRIVVV